MPTLIQYKCFYCKNIFTRRKGYGSNNKFCSRSCNALCNISGKNKNKIQLFCLRCGNEYEVNKARLEDSKYCSILCLNRSNSDKIERKEEKNPGWKGGIQTYRKKAWEYFEKKCSECGSENNLEIHHINSNRYDNRLENLKPVCRKCHQKLDGRISRRSKKGNFISVDDFCQPEPS